MGFRHRACGHGHSRRSEVTTFLSTPSSANLATAITDETGSGLAVFGTTPTLTTPTINGGTMGASTAWTITSGTPTVYVGLDASSHMVTGTPAGGGNVSTSGSITTGALPLWASGTGLSGTLVPGTGVTTALGVNVGSAGAFVVNGGALGTPSSGSAANLTGLPTSGIASISANTVLGALTATTPSALAVPSCIDSAGNHLNWTSGTGFSCGTTSSGGGSTGLSGMTASQIPVAANPTTVTSSLPTTGTSGVTQIASATSAAKTSGHLAAWDANANLVDGGVSTLTFTLGPDFTSIPGTQNTGSQTIVNGNTLNAQDFPVAKTSSYPLISTDGGTLLANGTTAITFTLLDHNTKGKPTPVFMDQSGNGFVLTTTSGTDIFYGFAGGGAAVVAPAFPPYSVVACTDDGSTGYACQVIGGSRQSGYLPAMPPLIRGGTSTTLSRDGIGTGPFGQNGAATSQAVASGTIFYSAFMLSTPITVSKISMRVIGGGTYTGTSNLYAALYKVSQTGPNGYPGALIADFGVLGTAGSSFVAAGAQTSAALGTPVVLTPGYYEIAYQTIFSGGSGTPAMSCRRRRRILS